MPRVVEIHPDGRAVNRYLPDEPCKTQTKK
jgi:hypothetical protein